MVLNFEKVDFNFVEQTINNTMMYILCSRDILEEEMKNIEGLKKNNLLEFFNIY